MRGLSPYSFRHRLLDPDGTYIHGYGHLLHVVRTVSLLPVAKQRVCTFPCSDGVHVLKKRDWVYALVLDQRGLRQKNGPVW